MRPWRRALPLLADPADRPPSPRTIRPSNVQAPRRPRAARSPRPAFRWRRCGADRANASRGRRSARPGDASPRPSGGVPPSPRREDRIDALEARACLCSTSMATGTVCSRPLLLRSGGILHVLPPGFNSDQRIPPTSPRRCPVANSSRTTAPNGQPSAASHTAAISASVNTRVSARSRPAAVPYPSPDSLVTESTLRRSPSGRSG